jgi:hypothetical protein
MKSTILSGLAAATLLSQAAVARDIKHAPLARSVPASEASAPRTPAHEQSQRALDDCLSSEVVCDGYCMPADAFCCGEGYYCDTDSCYTDGILWYCDTPVDDDDDFVSDDCFSDEEVCDGYCMPEGSLCCGDGYYCDPSDECISDGLFWYCDSSGSDPFPSDDPSPTQTSSPTSVVDPDFDDCGEDGDDGPQTYPSPTSTGDDDDDDDDDETSTSTDDDTTTSTSTSDDETSTSTDDETSTTTDDLSPSASSSPETTPVSGGNDPSETEGGSNAGASLPVAQGAALAGLMVAVQLAMAL